jgi:hypothetical protein
MPTTVQKRDGVHYTPSKLAQFLAEQTCIQFRSIHFSRRPIRVLDPACGDGELLLSLAKVLVESADIPLDQIQVFGFEKDTSAAQRANERIQEIGVTQLEIQGGDFLEFDHPKSDDAKFDIVIANPPYVRTQILGQKQAKRFGKRYGISGRVDLYHAFTIAAAELLRENGIMGLLTSNRFMTVKSGTSLRERLIDDFQIKQVFDLGDTKLFSAAVLPVVLTAIKRRVWDQHENPAADPIIPELKTSFCRVYQSNQTATTQSSGSILDAIPSTDHCGVIGSDDGRFLIERGELIVSGKDSIWSLSNQISRDWLAQIRLGTFSTFGEIAEVKVGIKTTADKVFVGGASPGNWNELPESQRPESKLLRPLLTHHDAHRWSISQPLSRTVLYPYEQEVDSSESHLSRVAIRLEDYPKTAAYLKTHQERLSGRKYVVESGKKWFEIWVAHRPSDWSAPKIVWPDISERPRFFLDEGGAIVNGDCYWIKLKPDVDPDWIFVMLAIANSQIATKFYDTVFHNKLYAGRRRYMTQYVKEFPLPDKDTTIGKKIIRLTKKLIKQPTEEHEKKLEALVQRSFGF